MFSKKLLIVSLFAAVALLTDGAAEVQADPIMTSGVVCNNATPGQANDFQRFTNAFVNVNAAVRLAVCAVPRSPALPAGANPVFSFTGLNGACTATSYLPDSTVQAQANFTWGAVPTTVNVTFPVALAGPNNYITLACNLNGAGAGVILSLTAAN
jgi:hypothetical protein